LDEAGLLSFKNFNWDQRESSSHVLTCFFFLSTLDPQLLRQKKFSLYSTSFLFTMRPTPLYFQMCETTLSMRLNVGSNDAYFSVLSVYQHNAVTS